MRCTRIAIAIAAATLALATATAQTPGTAFTYQGRLEHDGAAADGPYDLRFRLWLEETGPDNPIGPVVCKDNVAVTDGLFTTELDFGVNVFIGFPLWLEIEVRADATPGNCASGAFAPLTPRQPLTPTPYAVFATTAQTAGLRLPFVGTAGGGILLGLTNTATSTPNTSTTYFQNNSTGNDSRAVTGIAAGDSGLTYGVYGRSDSAAGYGVYGIATAATGINFGVFGRSNSPSGKGVFGQTADNMGVHGTATATTGINYGVFGDTPSSLGFGVYGSASATSGNNVGVYGISDSTTGRGVYGLAHASSGTNFGVSGHTNSPDGHGVHGSSAAASGDSYGVFGSSSSTSGRGVYGLASTATGSAYGVHGESASISGRAVFGEATAGTGDTYGGYFETSSDDGVGAYGRATSGSGRAFGLQGTSASTSGRGVFGWATSGAGAIYGVYGLASTAAGGYAVYASGNMGASGLKPFRIDHPTDPENKYLLHYAAESPEVINFYSGKVTLDNAGEALVTLPSYFARINKDPRYLLTPVGAAMPNLHVAEEISAAALDVGVAAGPGEAAPRCTFRIAGGVAGAKVCWEVKVLRNDLYVQNRGAPVEIEKQGLERGTYQHPEFYDQPPDKGMNPSAAGRAAWENSQ